MIYCIIVKTYIKTDYGVNSTIIHSDHNYNSKQYWHVCIYCFVCALLLLLIILCVFFCVFFVLFSFFVCGFLCVTLTSCLLVVWELFCNLRIFGDFLHFFYFLGLFPLCLQLFSFLWWFLCFLKFFFVHVHLCNHVYDIHNKIDVRQVFIAYIHV